MKINSRCCLVFVLFLNAIIFFLNPAEIFPQQNKIEFKHYSVAQGLFEPVAFSVIQDREGYLWFGTWGGIVKFDGYHFSNYKHDPTNPASIDIAFVQSLYEDKDGNIWAGTFSGLEKFNKKNSSFSHYKPHTPGPKTEFSNHVYSIFEDKSGKFWVGTGDGLNIFDRRTGKFTLFRHDSTDPGSIISNSIGKIIEDREGNLWIASGGGLDKYNRSNGKFVHVWTNPYPENEWSEYWLNTIFEDTEGILWLGSRKGIIAYNRKEGTFTQYLDIEGNSVSSICEDQSGNLWIGSWRYGLYSLNKQTNEIHNYSHDPLNPRSISSNSVTSLYFEKSASLWITTLEQIEKLDLSRKPFNTFHIEGIKSIIKGSSNKIWINTEKGLKILDSGTGQVVSSPFNSGKNQLLYDDGRGNLWFAKDEGGFFKQDSKGQTAHFQTRDGTEFKCYVVFIYESPDKTIWIGSSSDGLFSVNPADQKIENINIPAEYINCIYEDAYGILWVCTFNRGLYSYNRKTGKIKTYIYDINDSTSIFGQTTLYVCEDSKGDLWVNSNGGLNRYNRSNDSFIRYTDIPINAAFSILEDDQGSFWCNSREGIFKFNPETNSVQIYNAESGLPENGFKDWNGVRSDNGFIYFANRNELTGFHPDQIQSNYFIPPVVITNFSIFDKSFPVENFIELPHSQNFLSFEFAALNYISTGNNQYAYKMEGIDTGWVYSGTRRFASYPNLEPGEYTFRVKGSNNDGIWNETGLSLSIVISPPWWKSVWAYIIYAFLISAAMFSIRRYEMNRIFLKNKIKMDEAVLKEREETDEMKSRFFANISHEFRTPLTLILGPADKILSSSTDMNVIQSAELIKQNASRLLHLINQLLALSKLDAGKLNLQVSKGDIVSFVRGLIFSFESLAESRDITLQFIPGKDQIELYFDREKMIQILVNLISNAFKFTPGKGEIIISVDEIGSSAEIKIRDNGIGIASEEIPKLFNRFYQVDNSFKKEFEGTGIGLALTKELVELHSGNINVISKNGEWTEFTVTLPLKFKGGQISDIEISESGTEIHPSLAMNYKEEVSFSGNEIPSDKNIILIVEDNVDMRKYIKECLNGNYHTVEAENGAEGAEKAEKIIPDLIISDMMMPKMDGNELTTRLKNNEKTSHIPVIILTAKAGQEHKLAGLETGADDYLIKPFDMRELQVRIRNLIDIRKNMQAKFGSINHQPKNAAKKLSLIDEKFMIRVGDIIEKNISEEEFDMDKFCSELAMSRTQLHRKLKALTGKSASLYVRSVKLAKAKKMIEEKAGNISEVAYSLGFSSPTYFARCFKEEFGHPPSEIKNL